MYKFNGKSNKKKEPMPTIQKLNLSYFFYDKHLILHNHS